LHFLSHFFFFLVLDNQMHRLQAVHGRMPENALEIIEINGKKIAKYDSQKCLGTSCRRCVSICPENAIDMTKLKIKAK
jgi:ferredoxin